MMAYPILLVSYALSSLFVYHTDSENYNPFMPRISKIQVKVPVRKSRADFFLLLQRKEEGKHKNSQNASSLCNAPIRSFASQGFYGRNKRPYIIGRYFRGHSAAAGED